MSDESARYYVEAHESSRHYVEAHPYGWTWCGPVVSDAAEDQAAGFSVSLYPSVGWGGSWSTSRVTLMTREQAAAMVLIGEDANPDIALLVRRTL